MLGRAWQQATPEQRRSFTEEFRILLVRTYAKALLEYANEEIRVLPQPTGADGNETTIRTEVKPRTGQPIPINYSMHLGNDAWKVYDVTVEGVSPVSYTPLYVYKGQRYDHLPEDSSASILTSGLLGEQYVGLEPGGMDSALKNGSTLKLTQSALVLEKLIGRMVTNAA